MQRSRTGYAALALEDADGELQAGGLDPLAIVHPVC
jgi:hypothetical protein